LTSSSRPKSPTYLERVAVELDSDSMRALYVPERFAHGCPVLEDKTDASYEMSACYTPGAEGGLPHDDERDERLGLPWPLPVTVISAKDRNFRPLDEIKSELRRRMVFQRAASGRLAGAARPDHGGDGLQ
jgi:dTDP-4-dehydrorhamnose 3,5-epimerase